MAEIDPVAECAPIYVLGGKVPLLQAPGGFRTSLDSVMLAAACPAQGSSRVLDMGCGVGGASFCLLARVPDCHVTGVDIQPGHIELAQRNSVLNGAADRSAFICADIRDYVAAAESRENARFDHVICNPPYFEVGHYSPAVVPERARALGHEGDMVLKHWVDAGFALLRARGSLTMIHRADMSDAIIRALGRRFGAVEIIPLWPKAGQAARRVIIRAGKDRKSPATLHSGLILHEPDGAYTAAAEAVLRGGAAL